jgi:transcriptional regulator GlxA family with amidase domain
MDQRVAMAIELMKRNLHRNLTLAELARAVDLSPSRLRHLFRDEVGSSPARYLRTLRIDQSEALLANSKLSIKEIALRVGWQDRSHFERQFKKQLGVTPAQYRARLSAKQ